MAFTRITDADLVAHPGVKGQPVEPGLSPADLQAAFEERAEKVLVPAFNRLCEEIETQGAASIGAQAPDGVTLDEGVTATIQTVLGAMAGMLADVMKAAAAALPATGTAADSAKLNGQAASYYATAEALESVADAAAKAQSTANTAYNRAGSAVNQLSGYAKKDHKATVGSSYGMGDASYFGHVRLSDSVSSREGAADGVAATPKALQAVYDTASTAATRAANAQNVANAAANTAGSAVQPAALQGLLRVKSFNAATGELVTEAVT